MSTKYYIVPSILQIMASENYITEHVCIREATALGSMRPQSRSPLPLKPLASLHYGNEGFKLGGRWRHPYGILIAGI